jgi:membrane associated rhomboid family serine protease
LIPLKDNIRSVSAPITNLAIIGVTSIIFLLQLAGGDDGSSIVERYALFPSRIQHPEKDVTLHDVRIVRDVFGNERSVVVEKVALPSAVPPLLTFLTCIFLHGGWAHVLGNMWMLWIFGDNVEDRLGHVGYLIFYLACGIAASAAHYLSGPSSTLPTVGASGAIAGVMGAYFLFYPHARVLTLVPLGFFLTTFELPAAFFLGFWFLLQFFQGTLSVMSIESGGVAWWAHIGGFAVGAAVALVLKRVQYVKPKQIEARPYAYRIVRRPRDPRE